MTASSPTYDLVLLLDPAAEEPARVKVLADTKAAIGAKGEVTRHDEWGERALAYPIAHKATAEYHLLQVHASDTTLIGELTHTLHITDGVVRFRVNKLGPGTPEPPNMRPEHAAATREPAAPERSEPAAA